MIDRLQGQIEASKSQAASQVVALASSAAAQRRMQCQFTEREKCMDSATIALATENDMLKQLLEEARLDIDTLKTEMAEARAEAHDNSARFSSQSQVGTPQLVRQVLRYMLPGRKQLAKCYSFERK